MIPSHEHYIAIDGAIDEHYIAIDGIWSLLVSLRFARRGEHGVGVGVRASMRLNVKVGVRVSVRISVRVGVRVSGSVEDTVRTHSNPSEFQQRSENP